MDKKQFISSKSEELRIQQTLLALIPEVEKMKKTITGLKGSSNTEREKALDDISGALEVVTHHILDIMQESK